MARDLRINVDADASGARKGLDVAAAGVDRLRREADRLESEFNQVTDAAGDLDRQLLETKAATAALAAEFAKTGDTGVKKQLEEQRSAARQLQQLRSDIVGDTERDAQRAERAYEVAFAKLRAEEQKVSVAAERESAKRLAIALREAAQRAKLMEKRRKDDDEGRRDKGIFGFFGDAARLGTKAGAETASTFSAALQGGLMNAFKSLPAPAQAAIVAGIGSAISVGAPVIASALSAALLLGVGGAGLAAGIALAVSDAQVKSAFSGLGEILMANLRDAAKPFQGELVESANIFGKAFHDSLPDIKGIFATLAQAIRPLAGGLAGLVRNALPGLRRAAEAAVPIFKELARQAPEIGAALSDFFSSVAASGPGAVATFRELLNLTKGLIVATGGWLEQIGYVAQGAAIVNSFLIPIGKQSSVLSGPLTSSLEDVGAAAAGTSRAVHKLKLDLDELFGRQMDAREAAIAYEQALDDLAAGFKRGSDALDINNQKGRDNLRYIDDAINRARDKLKADLDAAGGSQAAIDASNRAYQEEINRIREVLRHLGLNEAEIDKLIGKANSIPRNITIDVGLVGANSAAGMLNQLGGAIGRLLGGVHVSASKQMQKRAGGGPVVAGQAYIVGEQRPEVFVPDVNGHILPDASAMGRRAASSTGSANYGAPTLAYRGNPAGLEAIFLSWLEKKFQNGDLQLAGR